jgi:leader peptidase (prepilin peptidase)/N-methyltransferase
VIYRLPRDLSVNKPAVSICPSCYHPINWYDNVPILSWILLGGRCRHCKTSISIRYPLVEVANTLLWAGLFVWYFVLGRRDGADEVHIAWPLYVMHVSLLSALLAASLIDLDFFIIPLSLPWTVAIIAFLLNGFGGENALLPQITPTTAAISAGGGLGMLFSLILVRLKWLRRSYSTPLKLASEQTQEATEEGESSPGEESEAPHSDYRHRTEMVWEILFLMPPVVLAAAAWAAIPRSRWMAWMAMSDHLHAVIATLFGLLIGGGVVWAARIVFTLAFGKEAMGLGDVHLMAGVGAAIGWMGPVVGFLLGPVLAIPFVLLGRMVQIGREIPFGPWLSLGVVCCILFFDSASSYLNRLLGGLKAIF